MKNSQTILLDISETREELNGLVSKSEMSSEEEQKMQSLTEKIQGLEKRYRAAVVAEDTDSEQNGTETETSTETIELNKLREAVSVGEIINAQLETRSVEGETAEYLQEKGLASNQVPIEILTPGTFNVPNAKLETRATDAPGDVQTNQQMFLDAMFPQSVAQFMGVRFDTVEAGESVYPVLVTNSVPDSVAKRGNVDDTDASFSANVLSPKRVQRSFKFAMEDKAKFPMMEEALRQNLNDAIASGIDRAALLSNDGLLNFGNDPDDDNAVTATTEYLSRVISGVDGRYAANANMVRVLFGAKTYEKIKTLLLANGDSDDLEMQLLKSGVQTRVSAHVPDPAANIQKFVVSRSMGRAVVGIWDAITILSDPYSSSQTGEIRLTAIALIAYAMLDANGYLRFTAKLA